ncbi:polysaccharide deacetylase family protein [Paenibacillus lignilyticus]|uniref:Polysaccharide deacetylase family protein n=1 Tax=Paenibacillus lignilyticus TaxID=1172615 RepID=A0ABS5CJS4_9BACL|nr:polysaccharide deacetylase family protein [Paenibacillus lignilyticus]MBP3966054.1 polysaccharide deacetylase family protein [Paenibacillus lignilyticus]
MKKKLIISAAILVLLILILFGTLKWMNSRTFQLFGGITNQVTTDQKVIALTFDDGPTANVDQILPLLDNYKAKATFFLIGGELEKNPDEGRKIAAAGHEIGNHTFSHDRMVFKSPSYIRDEIEKTNALIRQTGYKGEILFRPPYGKKLIGLPYYLNKHHMKTITWNLEPDTFYSTTADKVRYVQDKVKPGDILLLHPMYDSNEITAINEILQALKEQGYSFVTVSELLKLQQ